VPLSATRSPPLGRRRTVLSKGAGLVAQQILDTSEFFGEGARPHDSIWNFWVVFDLVPVHRLAHVEVHSETESVGEGAFMKNLRGNSTPYRNNGREEDEEPEDIDIPQPSEAIQSNQDERKSKRHGTKDLYRH
jgi:hypothetical protein